MKWLVDASPLCYPLTGIGYYVRGLLAALSAERPDWTFQLMAPYEPLVGVSAPNIIWSRTAARASARRRAGWRAWWFEFELPRAAMDLRGRHFWAADGVVPWCLQNIDVALTVYDFVPDRYPETMSWFPREYRRRNTRRWIPRARWRMPISTSVATEMAARYDVKADAIVHPGVDPVFFRRKEAKATSRSGSEYVLVVGTLEPRKNLVAMAEAIESLARSGDWPGNLRLFLVGARGWRDGALDDCIRRLENAGIAHRLGYVDREAVPGLMREARALLMPSVYEGFGMPVAEALVSGCPVICSDIPPFREIYTGPSMVFHGASHDSMVNAYREHLCGSKALPRPAEGLLDTLTWKIAAQRFVTATGGGVAA